jgi:hypothetical protein
MRRSRAFSAYAAVSTRRINPRLRVGYRQAYLRSALRFELRGLFGADFHWNLASGEFRGDGCSQLKHAVTVHGLELLRFHSLG